MFIEKRFDHLTSADAALDTLEAATAEGHESSGQPPGAVDGSGYVRPDPPTAPLSVPALNVDPSANVYGRPPGNILR
jgi:hypothetical protein